MTDPLLSALVVAPLSGTEPFHAEGNRLGFDVLGFWRWSASNLAGNAMRGVLAEYLVAQSLGLQINVRAEWDACDLRMPDGTRIEVKSAAYLQSWSQRRHSAISFDIGIKRGWDAETNTTAPIASRSADVYVFALLTHKDKATLDPLNAIETRLQSAGA